LTTSPKHSYALLSILETRTYYPTFARFKGDALRKYIIRRNLGLLPPDPKPKQRKKRSRRKSKTANLETTPPTNPQPDTSKTQKTEPEGECKEVKEVDMKSIDSLLMENEWGDLEPEIAAAFILHSFNV